MFIVSVRFYGTVKSTKFHFCREKFAFTDYSRNQSDKMTEYIDVDYLVDLRLGSGSTEVVSETEILIDFFFNFKTHLE